MGVLQQTYFRGLTIRFLNLTKQTYFKKAKGWQASQAHDPRM
jgi:hypothetical protein